MAVPGAGDSVRSDPELGRQPQLREHHHRYSAVVGALWPQIAAVVQGLQVAGRVRQTPPAFRIAESERCAQR